MLDLPTVTVILYDGKGDPQKSGEVMRRILGILRPASSVVVSHNPPVPSGWASVQVPQQDWRGGQKIQAFGLLEYLHTDHMMMVELDGFPVNPHHWDPEFLSYDYIGAPWGYKGCVTVAPPDCRVGNGGCSLQSKRLRQALWSARASYPVGTPSDMWVCQQLRKNSLAVRDMKFASIGAAIRFSYEAPIPEIPGWDASKSFAFHGRTFHPHLCP